MSRLPPTFAVLSLLLERQGYQRSLEGFREEVLTETQGLTRLIETGELLARDQQLQLYRRALYEARRNDLSLDASEAALLGVLRREQGISQVEHFLIEHHPDLQEFWDRPDCYERETNALLRSGLLFHSNGHAVIPEDVAPALWHALGLDMPTESARRLFSHLSNAEMADILGAAGSRVSGTKETRLDRMLLERIQPRTALQSVGLSTLKDICRSTDASPTGNKEELIERIVTHFSQGRDQLEEETLEVRLPETRRLELSQFQTLFSVLHHHELSDILRRQPELRQTGTKETRIRTLWDAHLSEKTLLAELMKYQLEDVLSRLGLQQTGSKMARVDRIVSHFETAISAQPPRVLPSEEQPYESIVSDSEPLERGANRFAFRQKASSPQSSLQPWLDTLLNANGMVRCYATEDANPTKQLKNKLAQAAPARGGVLVLLLADNSAYLRAREALIDRWATNAEWSKSVACVALAYPIGEATIHLVVETTANPWSARLKEKLFPEAEIFRIALPIDQHMCGACNERLPEGARFCPTCGAAVASVPSAK